MIRTVVPPVTELTRLWSHAHYDRISLPGAWRFLLDEGLPIGSPSAPVALIGGRPRAAQPTPEFTDQQVVFETIAGTHAASIPCSATAAALITGSADTGIRGIVPGNPVRAYEVAKDSSTDPSLPAGNADADSYGFIRYDDALVAVQRAQAAGIRIIAIAAVVPFAAKTKTEADFAAACNDFTAAGGLIVGVSGWVSPPAWGNVTGPFSTPGLYQPGTLAVGATYPDDTPVLCPYTIYATVGPAYAVYANGRTAQYTQICAGPANYHSHEIVYPVKYSRRGSTMRVAPAIVAGVAQLVWCANPDLTRDQVIEILLSTMDKPRDSAELFSTAYPRSDGPRGGVGIIDAELAVMRAVSMRADRAGRVFPFLRFVADSISPWAAQQDAHPREDPNPRVRRTWLEDLQTVRTDVYGRAGVHAGAFVDGEDASAVKVWLDGVKVYDGPPTSPWSGSLPQIESWRNDYRDVRVEADGTVRLFLGDVDGLTAFVKSRADTTVTLAGLRVADATVTVTCPAATVSDVTYPDATSWEVELSGVSSVGIASTATVVSGAESLDVELSTPDATSDGVTSSDSNAVRVWSPTSAGVTDSAACSDSVSCLVSIAVDVALPFLLAAAFVLAVLYDTAYADTGTTADAVVLAQTARHTDAISGAESNVIALDARTSDSSTTADSNAAVLGVYSAQSDTVSTSDVVAVVATFRSSTADAATTADTVAVEQTFPETVSVTDAATTSDSHTIVAALGHFDASTTADDAYAYVGVFATAEDASSTSDTTSASISVAPPIDEKPAVSVADPIPAGVIATRANVGSLASAVPAGVLFRRSGMSHGRAYQGCDFLVFFPKMKDATGKDLDLNGASLACSATIGGEVFTASETSIDAGEHTGQALFPAASTASWPVSQYVKYDGVVTLANGRKFYIGEGAAQVVDPITPTP